MKKNLSLLIMFVAIFLIAISFYSLGKLHGLTNGTFLVAQFDEGCEVIKGEKINGVCYVGNGTKNVKVNDFLTFKVDSIESNLRIKTTALYLLGKSVEIEGGDR